MFCPTVLILLAARGQSFSCGPGPLPTLGFLCPE